MKKILLILLLAVLCSCIADEGFKTPKHPCIVSNAAQIQEHDASVVLNVFVQ